MNDKIADAILVRVERQFGWFRKNAITWHELIGYACNMLLANKRLDLAVPVARMFAPSEQLRLRWWARDILDRFGETTLDDITPDSPIYTEPTNKDITSGCHPAALAELARRFQMALAENSGKSRVGPSDDAGAP